TSRVFTSDKSDRPNLFDLSDLARFEIFSGENSARWPGGRHSADLQTHHVPCRVATVNLPVGQHRRGPAFAAERLSPGQQLETGGGGLGHQQLPSLAQHDQLPVRQHERTFAGNFVRPLDLARVEHQAAKLIIIHAVDVTLPEDATAKVTPYVLVFPNQLG